jgi:hypothetical protein
MEKQEKYRGKAFTYLNSPDRLTGKMARLKTAEVIEETVRPPYKRLSTKKTIFCGTCFIIPRAV